MLSTRRVVTTSAAILAVALLIGLARTAEDAPATSDTAVTELYTRLAAHGQLLVGAYSRFQWHHPGPLPFYLMVPFYIWSGSRTAGLHAGAAALSILSLAVVIAVLWRRKPLLGAVTAAAMLALVWGAAEGFASPWNPHLAVLPLTALLVVTADVMAGRVSNLALVALLASLAGQAHVALMPCVLVVSAAATVRTLISARSAGGVAARRALLAAAGVLAVCWVLPVYEQVTATPRGNMTELWNFFTAAARSGQPWPLAISAWADMLVGIVRPDFQVAHGWPFVESPVRWAEWLTLAVLVAIAADTVIGVTRGASFDAAYGGILLTASAVALWSAAQIDERIFDHDVYWMSGLGALMLAAASSALLSWIRCAAIRGARSRTDHSSSPGTWHDDPVQTAVASSVLARVSAACIVTASVAALGVLVLQLRTVVQQSYHPTPQAAAARKLAVDLDAYLRDEGIRRPLINIDEGAWEIAAGVALDLHKRGRPVSVEEGWVVMFTPVVRATGQEDAVVTIANAPRHLELESRGAPLVAEQGAVFVHAERLTSR